MTNKMLILGIAIVAVGLIALPETLALFADQHTWYGIDQANGTLTGKYGVPCMKCHVDVEQQISAAANQVHKSTTCEQCHIVSQLKKAGVTVGGNKSIHAAAAPACLDCHGDNSALAGTYNFSGAPNGTSILLGGSEAHKEFVLNASASNVLEGANEACVGCHTHVQVDIMWQKPTNLTFNAKVSTTGVWTVDNFAATGSDSVNITSNASGPGKIV